MSAFEIGGTLPHGGQRFDAMVSLDVIAVRIEDRICVAQARWMTAEQARETARQLARLAALPESTGEPTP